MNSAEQTVQVTFYLPKDLYGRVAQAAMYEQRHLEELLGLLVAEGLDAHLTLRELFQQVSEQYRARLALERKLTQSPEQVLQELQNVREQIARELYPA